jgi:hypothetical protein
MRKSLKGVLFFVLIAILADNYHVSAAEAELK